MRSVEGPPDIEGMVIDLRRETTRIHAAFLFDSFGLEVLSKLCLYISSTKSSYKFAGWEEFGIHLGLNPLLIKVIIIFYLFDFSESKRFARFEISPFIS